MKKKSASQSAFLNLRVLTGLFMVLAGVFLALLGFGVAEAQQKYYPKSSALSSDPLVPADFDCSRISQLGIDIQENHRAGAIMIACGEAEGGAISPIGAFFQAIERLGTPDLGTTDVDLITGAETSPNVTQSETFTAANPDNPNQIIVAYNDSRGRNQTPINISGASVSTDGGSTFTRLTAPSGHSPFPNTSGDPVVLYNRPTGTWYTVWLDGSCGGQGLGGFKSTTPSDPSPASWTHYCVHSNSNDDRESGWADNNPSSPFYGRMYISWNDFNVGSGAIFVSYSVNNGVTWSAPVSVSTTFFRNVQITGDLTTGAVYIAAMDEMGGGLTNRANKIYRSTNGGVNWTNTYTGPTFAGPGRGASGFFATMYSSPAFWRHQGWGQPAALNGVVHYVYASRNTANGDPGNVFYIRSTDLGVTFSAPLMLNTNVETNKAQWQPNLSVTSSGSLLSVWYDERERTAASCQPSSPATPCYRMWARKSNDNGATWLPDEAFSDVVTPLPLQPDPGIQALYAGDYDYASSFLNQHISSWVDGRVSITGASQQNAFVDRAIAGFAVTTTVPAVGSVVFSQPTSFVVNVTDPVQAASLQGSDLTVNGSPATSVSYTAGTMTMTFNYSTTPVLTQGLQTMHIAAGAFLKASDASPVAEFTGTFRYDVVQLQVTTTNPPVGGTFTFPSPFTYDVNFNEAVDPASVQTGDLTLSGISGSSVTAVNVINANMTARFTIDVPLPGTLTASISAGGITDAFGNPNAVFSGNYTVNGCVPNQYIITAGTDPIVAGTTDIGNHTDDGATSVTLPFTFKLYNQNFTSVNVSSNGHLDFVVINEPGGYVSACLPAPNNQGPYDKTIFGLWNDLRTDAQTGCSGYPGGTCGIFTLTSGIAPNRIFNIEWRSVLYASPSSRQNFEVRLYENPAQNQRFDVIYGTVNTTGADRPYVGGVQGTSPTFSQDFCGTTPPQSVSRTYIIEPCATPTPSPTPTATATATATVPPSPTPTPTPALVSISGAVTYCSNPALPPVAGVTMNLTGPSPAPSSTPTNASGIYTLSSLTPGGNYVVTPTKAALAPASLGINTVDVVAIQRHVLTLGTPLSGCRLTAADVNPAAPAGVNTIDVVATQRFTIGLLTGTANAGQYQFSPANRSYPGISGNQIGQNYDALVFGDVASGFVNSPTGGPSQPAASGDDMSASELAATVAAIALPEIAVDQSKSNLIGQVTTTDIDAKNKLVGFQGDFTFDERVVTFQSEPVRKAGLTAGNWNVAGNVLAGAGPIRTLRVSAYSNDFTPLSGSGTLFELRMTRVSKAAQSTQLIWAAPPEQFIFIDADLKTQKAGNAAPGSVTSSGQRK